MSCSDRIETVIHLDERCEAKADKIYGSTSSTQHFFYNFVDPAQVHLYGRPANAVNDAAWEKAVRENPDPSWYVLSHGFSTKLHRHHNIGPGQWVRNATSATRRGHPGFIIYQLVSWIVRFEPDFSEGTLNIHSLCTDVT